MHITLNNLSKHFGALKANDAISLAFAAGQIHGVLGENGAGKSTLMKLLSGFLRRTSGEVLLDGQPARLSSPAEALRAGVGMVHQEPLDVPAFSVIENFFCASPRSALPTIQVARQQLAAHSDKLGFAMDADAPLRSLTVGQRQQLEIMRLLACGAQLLILDEPTTGISAAQARALFGALRTLANEGKTVLFVSHKLHEVAELCDTVSVLRAGRVVEAQLPMPQPAERLLRMMFGQLPEVAPETLPVVGTGVPVWQLRRATLEAGALTVRDLDLTIRPGEVVGLAGLEGSGQRLLLRALAGHLRPVSGSLHAGGNDLTGAPIKRFLEAGIEYLPADRLAEGVIGSMTLQEHEALRAPRAALVDWGAAAQQAQQSIADYAIKATPQSPLRALSGGNQQRAMLAFVPERCQGIVLEQPTRGLDVASARAVWQRLLARRADGTALVFASSELDELLTYSDRVLVFFAGRVSPPLDRHALTGERLAELIGGVGL